MKSNTFVAIVTMISAVLGAVVFIGIDMGEPAVPLVALFGASLVIMSLKPKVKEVKRDEMLDQIAGKSAKFAMLVFSWVALISGIVLMTMQDGDWAEHQDVGYALAYFGCGMLITYAIMTVHYTRKAVG